MVKAGVIVGLEAVPLLQSLGVDVSKKITDRSRKSVSPAFV
ncbi:hypothetical protein [Tumebacillus algifaecis]|nr:hypothetical protein [Tumebacillus algifaecis]